MTSEKGCKKEKNQNIQVFVRLRPLNQRERDIKSLGVVEVAQNREVIVRHSQAVHTKKFTFDKAFGPNATQVEVYHEVVRPLIVEVLCGYNCTVFAYGQTGTGKTHTMVGENSGNETNWQSDPLAGIIPRALSQLFDELRLTNSEYTVRVSYLELYNEELFDLLSTSEDNSKLRIYEDVTRKGSNIVNGLEEITVYSKSEVYKIMAQGQERKKVASTLMNAQSSRSHTVFTIVVHMKENSPEGEELVKIGKLNLVDLAGSENISKAGSDNPAKKERARECVNINQSLLTLGRVITALVERHPHIPYRESKLTRILQESLGGRTKTSIIATISPGHKDLEETMSTLEYANRAKNIQNKPEINQKMTKKAILKEFAEEIDRLKRDLQAARDKNGVYLANEDFTELTLKQEEQRKEIQELLLKERALEDEKKKMMQVFEDLNKTLEHKMSELNSTKSKLYSTKTQLEHAHNVIQTTKQEVEEKAYLVEKQQETESTLSVQAKQLLDVAELATTHVVSLHDVVDKRREVESRNMATTATFRDRSSKQRNAVGARTRRCNDSLGMQLQQLHSALENIGSSITQTLEGNNSQLQELVDKIADVMEKITAVANESQCKLMETAEAHRETVQTATERQHRAVEAALLELVRSVAATVHSAQGTDLVGNVHNFVNQWCVTANARVSSLRHSHEQFATRVTETSMTRRANDDAYRRTASSHVDSRVGHVASVLTVMETEKAEMERRHAQKLAEIEFERQEKENRLQQWIEEEMRLFEQRLQAHANSERQEMELRLKEKMKEIEDEQSRFSSRFAQMTEWQQMMQKCSDEERLLLDQQQMETENNYEKTMATLKDYSTEIDEGTSAISIDMEMFNKNVVEVIDHIYSKLIQTLIMAKEQIERDSQNVVEQDAATNKQFVQDSDEALTLLVNTNKELLNNVLSHIQANNASTIDTLKCISNATSSTISLSHSYCSSHKSTVEQFQCQLGQFCEEIHEDLKRHEELEGQYLGEEYKVYESTGSTPHRTQFRFPRALAATSPHERILRRFRAARNTQPADIDEECVIVDSDTESPSSDVESLVSEEFLTPMVPFAQTSPPTFQNGHIGGIVKCTSETDIYAIKRKEEQGKENADRSMTYKKRSKLPAPASQKKPLIVRNN